MKKNSYLILLILPMIVCGETNVENNNNKNLDTVHVDGKNNDEKNQKYRNTNSSVYISNEEITRFTPISTGDIFKGQPGIQIGDVRNGGGVDVNIRGVQGQSRVPVTIDGTQQALNIYRGYAGTQQRSYIDSSLISSITIDKETGKPMDNGISGIGGTVAVKTLNVSDIIPKGKSYGLRLTGQIWNNGIGEAKQPMDGSLLTSEDDLRVIPTSNKRNIFNAKAKSGSIAFGYTNETIDIVLAYAKRQQGNYFTGKHGYNKYRKIGPRPDWCSPAEYNEPWCQPVEGASVAKSYKAKEEVLNSSSNVQSFLAKATIRPVDGHSISLGYNLYDSTHGEIMPSDIYRLETAGIFQYPKGGTKIDRLNIQYNYNPSQNPLIDTTFGLWYTKAKTEQLNAVETPKSENYIDDRGWVKQDNKRIGASIKNTSNVNTSIGEFALDIGAAFKNERIAPQSEVDITIHDLNANRSYRNAKRSQYNFFSTLSYLPNDNLTLWGGVKYEKYRSQDFNRKATAKRKNKTFKRIRVYNTNHNNYQNYHAGYMNWFPDANGDYTDATDPRLNGGIIHEDQNYPQDGITYDEFTKRFGDTTVQDYGESTTDVVVGFDFAKAQSQKGSVLSFSLGSKYEFYPDSFIYASYTQGGRTPSLFETTMGTTQVTVENESEIKAERSSNWEVGISSQKNDVFAENDEASFKVAYFNNKLNNYITRYFTPGRNGIMSFSNTDYFKVSGLELQASYDNGGFFADISGTRYLKTVTCDKRFASLLRANDPDLANTPNCTDGSFMGSYLNTQNPPKYAVNLTLGTRLLDEKLVIGGRLTHTSAPNVKIDKPWQESPTTPQVYYRPVTTLDIFAKYNFSDNGEVNVSVQNLTNRYYIDPLVQSFMPAPGRTVQLGFKYKF